MLEDVAYPRTVWLGHLYSFCMFIAIRLSSSWLTGCVKSANVKIGELDVYFVCASRTIHIFQQDCAQLLHQAFTLTHYYCTQRGRAFYSLIHQHTNTLASAADEAWYWPKPQVVHIT